MQGHPIKWFTDNQNVVSIVKFGSKKPHLQDGAVSIFDTVLNSHKLRYRVGLKKW